MPVRGSFVVNSQGAIPTFDEVSREIGRGYMLQNGGTLARPTPADILVLAPPTTNPPAPPQNSAPVSQAIAQLAAPIAVTTPDAPSVPWWLWAAGAGALFFLWKGGR